MKLTNTIVSVTAQGHSAEVDATDFHADSVAAIFAYGLRRWFQDHINSQAKAARDDGTEITDKWAKETFDSRLAQAVSGEITMRSAATNDPLDQYRLQVIRIAFRNDPKSDSAQTYAAIPSDDQKARRAFLLEVARNNAKKVDPVAEQLRQQDEARKAEMAGLSVAV